MNTPISTFYDYLPGSALTPGIPPILGAGKLIEFEDDFQYMKQLYPEMCKKLLNQIEECCDHLEYEGSILFDSYPDKITLERMAKKILEDSLPADEKDSFETLLPLTVILLYQEILYRRIRYRSRKRLYM